jgi:hypothetical protein
VGAFDGYEFRFRRMVWMSEYVEGLVKAAMSPEKVREGIEARIKDVYGGIPEAPKGYRVVDFRGPCPNDIYLDAFGIILTANSTNYYRRLILEPITPVMVTIVKYVPVVEEGKHAFRRARYQEYYSPDPIGAPSVINYRLAITPSEGIYYIWRRVVEQVPVESV